MHFFLFKQKTAYEMRISDWSSDVCSSDLAGEKLLNPPEGKGVVEGRMAFFDVLADARWGGIISGDKVQVEFDSGLDGVRTAIVRSVARYADLAEGEDKLTCAGSIDSYVRGAIAA